MIVVSGLIRLAPDSREAAVKAAAEMARETRQEQGCHTYAFYSDLEDPNVFRVFEEWADDASLKAHGQTAHMKRWRATLAGLTVESREIKRYVVEEMSTL